MAINLLGNNEPQKRIRTEEPVILHQPEKEAVKKVQSPKIEPKKIEPLVFKEDLADINLMSSFKIRRLEIILISIIIILAIGVTLLYINFQNRTAPNVINTNLNQVAELINVPAVINENININQAVEPIINENVNIPIEAPVIFPPVIEPEIPAPIVNTKLAPLRGSLVKFSGSSEVYLVEWQGELRRINQQTAVFKSKETISSLSAKNQIYLINSKFIDVKRGSDVSGYVAWDPRILSPEEIELYK